MKEKLKAYLLVSLCFVAFSMVMFALYYSKGLTNKESLNRDILRGELTAAESTFPYVLTQNKVEAQDTPKRDSSSKPVTKELPAQKDTVKKAKEKEITVYFCNSTSAYAYHANSYCQGLRNCKAEINAVTKTHAENFGRRPCKKCY
ncbi:MAG: hypothetical protein F9K23_16065 [Bacteroidetes bacterium]|nr:MAG: hypothetical protein F9K23_16065 [Bacteroidota bacterium]